MVAVSEGLGLGFGLVVVAKSTSRRLLVGLGTADATVAGLQDQGT